MANLNISINMRRPFGRNWGGVQGLSWLYSLLGAIDSGAVQSDAVIYGSNDDMSVGNTAYAGQAVAALVGSTLTGAVGATIDGTLVTVTAAGGDTATQALLKAAIIANTSVNRKVTPIARVAQLTLASVLVGTTVKIFGVLFTAVTNAAAITDFGQFNIDGADTADATALALAINRHPSLAGRVRATSNAGVVYVGMLDDRAPRDFESISTPSAATITINTAVPTAGAVMLLASMVPGDIGNCVTVVASGTGMTVATANAGKLGGGTGGSTSVQYVVP